MDLQVVNFDLNTRNAKNKHYNKTQTVNHSKRDSDANRLNSSLVTTSHLDYINASMTFGLNDQQMMGKNINKVRAQSQRRQRVIQRRQSAGRAMTRNCESQLEVEKNM